MKRLTLLIGVCTAMMVIGAIFAGAGGAQRLGEQTIVLVSKPDVFKLVDSPPKSRANGNRVRISAGDYFVFTSQAFTSDTDKHVGTSQGFCVATDGGPDLPDASFLCVGGFALVDGTITWTSAGKGSLTLAVTGGTGAYEGVRGTVLSEPQSDGTSLETIHLLP